MLRCVISLVQFINNLSQKKAEIAFSREVGLDERAPRPPTGQVALAINFPLFMHMLKKSLVMPLIDITELQLNASLQTLREPQIVLH